MDARYIPISPPIERGPRGADLPAYVSNGLIGLRVRENPLEAGMCMVNGFVGEHHEYRVEAAAAAPYPLSGDIALDGHWASDRTGAVEPADLALPARRPSQRLDRDRMRPAVDSRSAHDVAGRTGRRPRRTDGVNRC